MGMTRSWRGARGAPCRTCAPCRCSACCRRRLPDRRWNATRDRRRPLLLPAAFVAPGFVTATLVGACLVGTCLVIVALTTVAPWAFRPHIADLTGLFRVRHHNWRAFGQSRKTRGHDIFA